MSVRPVPEAIQWHEGMLLAPQHFQQLVLRQDALLAYHAALLAPFHWGVRRLRIDAVRLGEGRLRVTELEAVMPDGLIAVHGASAGSAGGVGDLEIDLTAYADAMKSGPVTVHLAVPAIRAGLSPVKGELPRFESVAGEPIADETTGEGDLRVPRLRPRLSLLVADNPPQKYVSFPLAKVSYSNETFAATEFLPPTLAVALASPLGELCAGIARRLREKALFLSDRARSPSVASRPPQLLETRATIHSLVAALPQLEAVLNTGVAHPFPLYLALTWLVGHLAAVGRGLVPPVLDPYDHDDPYASFSRARDFIFRVVDEGILESFTAFPFYLEKGVFNLSFDEEWRARRLVLGVRGQPDTSDAEVAAWVQQCLIGSKGRMPGLRDRRILGAKRERVEGDGDLVPATGVVLFGLEADPEIVEPNQLLQMWNAGDRGEPRASEVVLYVKNRR
jgi:type VI secretion system protein ImpJ